MYERSRSFFDLGSVSYDVTQNEIGSQMSNAGPMVLQFRIFMAVYYTSSSCHVPL